VDSAHNPFFNNEKTRKDTKNFIGVAALTDEMALGFAAWLVVLSDRSADWRNALRRRRLTMLNPRLQPGVRNPPKDSAL
jgi:hypothetical protein